MAFDRKLKVFVGPSQLGADKIEISKLHIEFTVTRSNTFGENTAVVKIYNPSEDTKNKFLVEGNNCWIHAGYEDDEFSQIFSGNIITVKAGRFDTDTVVELFLGAVQGIHKAVSKISISLSYAPKTLASTVLRELADFLEMPITGLEVADIPLPNGFAETGPLRIVLRGINTVLRSNNVGLYIDNSEIILHKIHGFSPFESVAVGYNSGLISVEDVTDPYIDQQEKKTKKDAKQPDRRRKLSIKMLLHPRVRPNGLIRIVSDSANGLFLVTKVEFSGDNFGGDFQCIVGVVEPNG